MSHAKAPEICSQTKCRKAVKIAVPVDKDHYQEINIPISPYVDPSLGMVVLLPGDSVHVSVTKKDGHIASLSYSEKPSDLEFKFSKIEPKDKIMTMLTVKNNMTISIVYSALVNSPKSKWRHFSTSTCPVRSKKSTFESWPYPISQILVRNVRFAQKSETKCMKY